MLRLLGIFTGAAIAAGFLVAMIGLPEFPATPAEPVMPEQPAVGPVPDEPMLDEPMLDEPMHHEPMHDEPDPAASVPPSRNDHEAHVDDVSPQEPPPTATRTAPDALPEPVAGEVLPPDEANWYAFWSPFRSEIAADGFIAELQRTTGMDYRVVKLKPGAYEVAFAYSDESDIRNKLVRISTATGLDLGGG